MTEFRRAEANRRSEYYRRFPEEEYDQRWRDLRYLMDQEGYDAVVVHANSGFQTVTMENLTNYVTQVMENFDRFAIHLRHEAVSSTTNNLERYYGNTKPTHDPRRFRSVDYARAFLSRQMRVRTVKQGLISRDWSLSLARELFPTVSRDELEPFFADSKRRYLSWRDFDPGQPDSECDRRTHERQH